MKYKNIIKLNTNIINNSSFSKQTLIKPDWKFCNILNCTSNSYINLQRFNYLWNTK